MTSNDDHLDPDQLFVLDPSTIKPLKTLAVQKFRVNNTSYEIANLNLFDSTSQYALCAHINDVAYKCASTVSTSAVKPS